jgi:hypothetical protein
MGENSSIVLGTKRKPKTFSLMDVSERILGIHAITIAAIPRTVSKKRQASGANSAQFRPEKHHHSFVEIEIFRLRLPASEWERLSADPRDTRKQLREMLSAGRANKFANIAPAVTVL